MAIPRLPAAAAVELVHNFSLVHDDIEDNSDKRRGRTTVWKKWGMPQGINAGDGLFVLSNLALTDLEAGYPAQTILRAAKILHATCLDLTRGQFLDISYEDRADLTVEDYWPMVSGKTAALLSACCQIGALLGGADEARQEAYRAFGYYLGLAFQVQDDILGIWGNEALTGKSAASDLVEGRNRCQFCLGWRKRESSRNAGDRAQFEQRKCGSWQMSLSGISPNVRAGRGTSNDRPGAQQSERSGSTRRGGRVP